jgi:hypothetical protein
VTEFPCPIAGPSAGPVAQILHGNRRPAGSHESSESEIAETAVLLEAFAHEALDLGW